MVHGALCSYLTLGRVREFESLGGQGVTSDAESPPETARYVNRWRVSPPWFAEWLCC